MDDDDLEDVAGPAPYGRRDPESAEAWMWFHEQMYDDLLAQATAEGLLPADVDR